MALPLSYPNFHTNISTNIVDNLVNAGVYIESTVHAFLHKNLHEVTSLILTPDGLTTEEWTGLNASFAKASDRYLKKSAPEAAVSATAWAKHLTTALSELPRGQGYTPIIYAVGTTLTCITACFVAVRLYSKKKLMNRLRIEDWIILFCLFNGATYSTLMQKSVELGGGTHIWEVTWSRQLFIMKCAFLCNFFYSTAIMSVKVALLCFYYRLSPARSYRYSVLGTIMFISMLYVSTVLTLAFSCKPIAYWTNPWEKKCINEKAFWMSTAIINMITDIVTLLIPTPVVWKLQLKKREKVGIILLFGLGLFACFASTLRIMTLNGFFESTDFTYKEALTGLWGLVELDVAIICSCVPSTKALVTHAVHRNSDSDSIGELSDFPHLYHNHNRFKDFESENSNNFNTNSDTTTQTTQKHESVSTTTEDVTPTFSDDGRTLKRHSGVVRQMDALEEARQRVQMFTNYSVSYLGPPSPEPKFFDERERRAAIARERLRDAGRQQKVMPPEDRLGVEDSARVNHADNDSVWGSIGSAGTSGTGGVILTTREFEERERNESIKSEDPRLEKFRFDFQ